MSCQFAAETRAALSVAAAPAPPAIFLLTKEAADMLRISTRTLEAYRLRGGGPPFARMGRRIVYPVDGVRAWVEQCMHSSTSAQPEPS